MENRSTALVMIVVGVLLAAGFYLSNERTKAAETRVEQVQEQGQVRSVDVNAFLREQCKRDELRNSILIGALEDAKRRAQKSLAHRPNQQAFEVGRIQLSIDGIKGIVGDCARTIPPTG